MLISNIHIAIFNTYNLCKNLDWYLENILEEA